MIKLPLLNELIKYHEEDNLILSMPGNKSGIGFLRDEVGQNFINKLGYLDITEVDPLDNLHCPEGIIKEALWLCFVAFCFSWAEWISIQNHFKRSNRSFHFDCGRLSFVI